MSRLPDFLIVGAQKSGTSSVAYQLRRHPQIFMPSKKECHFFDRHHDRGIDWYRAQFSGATDERTVGEATPYMADEFAMARIHATLPDALLVVLLRNPVDRAYSHYWMERARGREDLTFEDALAAEGERLTASPSSLDRYGYVTKGHYVQQLVWIRSHYSDASVRVLLFDDLRDHPTSTLRELCTFLGVEPRVPRTRSSGARNRHRTFRSSRLQKRFYRLPQPLRFAATRLNTLTAPYEPMDRATRERLLGLYRDEIDELSRLLGRDLSCWQPLR